MQNIYEKLQEKIGTWRSELSELAKANGDKIVSEVTVAQLLGGMRGVKGVMCDTSNVPQDKGLIIRGMPLADLVEKSPEEVFYLLLTGELPDVAELEDFSHRLKLRKTIPSYVWDVLKAMPKDTHPMVMLNTAILVLQRESIFAKMYEKGMKKDEYWKHTLEDALNIVAKLPGLAAAVYRLRFNKGPLLHPNPDQDLSGDFVHLMGLDSSPHEFYELVKLFLSSHADHEGGNVSAFTTLTVNSALSDLYYSMSAGFDGLAGPLHGLANQEVVKWILETMKLFGGNPTREQIAQYAHETLESGKVIPGYGHAVLRVVDPRFTAFMNFGKKYCKEDPLFQTVEHIFETVPGILQTIAKIKDPWPNIDAISGSIIYHYGIKEFSYYTVIFALSRGIGLAAQAVVNRGLQYPIVRPKSVTTPWLKDFLSKN
ncbi:MAG: citrate (Si)-synthase [Ignavibacteriaceae bacterium]|jgi:citrate synthase